jgi:thiol-disulfide isomerase/thioredoxin
MKTLFLRPNKKYMNIKNRIKTICLLAASMFVISGCNQSIGAIKCTLKGEVIDRPQSSQLLLLKHGESPIDNNGVYIPINNGKFEYILNCKYEEKYYLAFSEELGQGQYRVVEFFSEHGVINFTLHPSDQFKKNIVEGGELNREYQDYFSKVNELSDAEDDKISTKVEQYLNDNYSEALKKHDALDKDVFAKIELLMGDGFDIYPNIEAVQNSVYQETSTWKAQYVREHPSIAGYSILVSAVEFYLATRFQQQTPDVTPYVELYHAVFAPMYPDHPYTEQMTDFIAALSFKAGDPYIDFTAVDFDGKFVKLSERIAGKPAVLHLWASWCGYCRRDGLELIPVYEEFRDKGFVIIGVARERGSSSAAEAAVKLHKYPWENLVEIDDAGLIWNKYGMGGAGGCKFLIDEKGIIVAINPSVEEIRNFLNK